MLRQTTGTVYVVGGNKAVPDSKVAAARSLGSRDFVRIAGVSRWATAWAVGQYAATGRLPTEAARVLTSDTSRSPAGALWPSSVNDCEGALPVVVAGDAAAQSDIYASMALAGVVGSRCLIDAGDRDGPLPFASRAALAGSLRRGFVVGGRVSVPATKTAGYSLARFSGSDRWQTAHAVGRFASGRAETGMDTGDEKLFAKVAVGPSSSACALRIDGSVLCWRGVSIWESDPTDGTGATRKIGVQDLPATNSRGTDIAIGHDYACLLLRAGRPDCWGIHSPGETPSTVTAAADLDFLSIEIVSRTLQHRHIRADYLCGLTADGKSKCIALDSSDKISNSGSFASAAVGSRHMCAIDMRGRVHCTDTELGRLADLPTVQSVDITAGEDHSCLLSTIQTVQCWRIRGDDDSAIEYFENFGEFPPDVSDSPAGRYRSISSGPSHACAVTTSGSARCWGQTWYGESTTPKADLVDLSTASATSCGVRSDGDITCWGFGYTTAHHPDYRGAVVSLGNHSTGVIVESSD